MQARNTTIWKEAPFIRLIIPFAGGIISERYLQFPLQTLVPGISGLLLAWIVHYFLPLHVRFYLRPVYGLLVHAAFFLTGTFLTLINDPALSATSLSSLYKRKDVLIVRLNEPVTETRASYKTIATVLALYRNDSCIAVRGNMLLYFRKDSVSARLRYGEELAIFAETFPIQPSGNPGTFDFASYARLQGILMQAFVSSEKYVVIRPATGKNLKAWLLSCKKLVCDLLKMYIPGKKESGLAEALLVGYKEDLDKDLLQVYSNTGVVHVIAISGLHLGILYIICKGILSLFPVFRNSRWCTSTLIIVFLWLFSLLTGGAPSVLRSAVMFTAILFGDSFTRKISMYNCLAASAFILLTYHPYWIFDIGFQLSYSAVLSILLFSKSIEQLLYVKNRLLDKVWQMTAVTLAAQVLTTPVSIFYFNQFPNYFLLANLVAVPLSSIILIGTIILCMVSFIPFVGAVVGSLLAALIRCMNGAVEHINYLPFSVTTGIPLSLLQVILLYVLIGSLSLYLFRVRKIFLMMTLTGLLGMALLSLNRQMEIRQRQMLIVYNIKGKQVIEILNGKTSIITGLDAACIEMDCRPIINAAHTLYGITKTERTTLPHHFRGKKVAICFISTIEDIRSTPPASIVILSPSMTGVAETICRQLRPVLIVLDASHSARSVRLISNAGSKHHINIHAVSNKGAFVKRLN